MDLYSGDQGSGKTYQVCTVSIKEALNQGRRILTNVRGVNAFKIIEALKIENKDDGRKYGDVVFFRLADLRLFKSFYPDLSDDKFQTMADVDLSKYMVQPGDLLVLDEGYEAYPRTEKLDAYVLIFFMKHRHYVNEITKLTTEVIIMTQDPAHMNKDLLSTVQYTFHSTKKDELGVQKFNIDVYKKLKRYRDKPMRQMLMQTYDKTKFEWYKSHALDGAIQMRVDKRQNVFSGLYYKVLFIGAPIIIIGCGYYLLNFLTSRSTPAKLPSDAMQQQSNETTNTATNTQPVKPVNPYENWYIAGVYQTNKNLIIYISDGTATKTVTNPIYYRNGRVLNLKMGDIWLTNYNIGSQSSFLPQLPK